MTENTRVVIEREGRWRYYLQLREGPMEGATHLVFGRRRAEAKARRLLAKTVRRRSYTTITP